MPVSRSRPRERDSNQSSAVAHRRTGNAGSENPYFSAEVQSSREKSALESKLAAASRPRSTEPCRRAPANSAHLGLAAARRELGTEEGGGGSGTRANQSLPSAADPPCFQRKIAGMPTDNHRFSRYCRVVRHFGESTKHVGIRINSGN
jgi:hypothetical protein